MQLCWSVQGLYEHTRQGPDQPSYHTYYIVNGLSFQACELPGQLNDTGHDL